MKAWSAIFAGMLFGLGLTLSGMSDPLKVMGFLDVSGDWIPESQAAWILYVEVIKMKFYLMKIALTNITFFHVDRR